MTSETRAGLKVELKRALEISTELDWILEQVGAVIDQITPHYTQPHTKAQKLELERASRKRATLEQIHCDIVLLRDDILSMPGIFIER